MRTGERAGRPRSGTTPPARRRTEPGPRSRSAPARRPANGAQSSRARRRALPSRCPATPTAASCGSRRAELRGCASPGSRIAGPPRPVRRIRPSRSAPSGSDRQASGRIRRARRHAREAGPAPPPDCAGAGSTARRRARPRASRDPVCVAGTARRGGRRSAASRPVPRSTPPLPGRERRATVPAPMRPRARAPVHRRCPATGG